MPNRSEIFKLSERKLIGKLLYTDRGGVEITNIVIPIMKNVLVISKDDLSITEINFYESKIPILAGDYSYYKGQPILAVFANNIENLNLCISEIKITYKEDSIQDEIQEEINSILNLKSTEKTNEIKSQALKSFNYGNTEKFFTSENKTFSTSFTVNSHKETLLHSDRIFSYYNNNSIYIKFMSQWPFHVRDCICNEMKIRSDQVFLYPDNFTAPYDQLLYMPSIACVIAAIASKKINGLIELDVDMTSHQMPLSFQINSSITEDNKIQAQKIIVKADMGAITILKEEFAKNIIAGLTSPYRTEALSIDIEIFTSASEPAFLFGDIGYSAALSASEYHISRLSDYLGVFPDEFRLNNISKNEILKKIFNYTDLEFLKESLNECSNISMFKRIYAVNSLNRPGKSIISPQVDYSRGIGIACGNGILGFSLNSTYIDSCSISLSFTKEKKLIIKLGTQIRDNIKNICHSIISKNLQVKYEDIIFDDINNTYIQDFGPTVLSKNRELLPTLLTEAINLIKKELDKNPNDIIWPINVTYHYQKPEGNEFFNVDSSGCMCIFLHVDSLKLTPVIDNIWLRLNIGKTFDLSKLNAQVQSIILLELSCLFPHVNIDYKLDIEIQTDKNKNFSASSTLIRGLTAAAFTSALSQATNYPIKSIPFSDSDIMNIINLKNRYKKEEGTKNEN